MSLLKPHLDFNIVMCVSFNKHIFETVSHFNDLIIKFNSMICVLLR